MINFPRSFACRFVASLLAFVLVQTAPGTAIYQAAAQIIRTSPAGTAGNMNASSPSKVDFAVPSANTVLAPSSSLGLNSALQAPSAVPHWASPSVAVNAVKAAQAANPLPFLPAAAKAVPVNAAAAVTVVPALTPAVPAAAKSSLVDTGASLAKLPAANAPASEPTALLTTLSRLFDGSIEGSGLSAPSSETTPVVTRPGDSTALYPHKMKPLSEEGRRMLLAALETAKLKAPAIGDEPPSAPSSNGTPQAPRKLPVGLGLALAGLGGAAAWYTSAWAAAAIGGLLAPFFAVPALALSIGWIALGTSAGFAGFSLETWKGFPARLKDTSYSAGGTTFRFWARFGLIFDSVLRGKTADAKAPTPGNILKYPVIAWVFVLAGYVMAPLAFVLGAAYRLVGTPFIAAFRGARDVVVGFLPWMARVFNFLGRLLRRIGPFVGGLLWGAVKTAFLGAAAGAVVLSGPIARDAFETRYKPASVPGWIAYRLTQLAAILAILVTGAAGAVIGLLSSPVHVVMGALQAAFDWSGVNAKGEAFFTRWTRSIEKDGGLAALVGRGFPEAKENLSLGARMTRVLNGTLISAYVAVFVPFLSIATIIRAFAAAAKGVDAVLPDSSGRSTSDTGAEPAVAARPGFALPAALGAIGLVGGAAAGWFFFGPLLLAAAGGVLGLGLGLAASQPQAWSGWLSGTISEGRLSGEQAFGGWLDGGRVVLAGFRGNESKGKLDAVALVIPAVAGAVAAAFSAVFGGLHAAAAKPVVAAWTGFMALVTQFLPALKRLLNWLGEVLKNIVPFAFGFVFGTFFGVFRAGWFVAANLFRPVGAIFEREQALNSKPSEAQIGFGVLLGLTLLAPALAAFAGAFVLGAVVGLPVAFTHGAALGVKWAGTGEASERYFRTWSRRSLPAELKKAEAVVDVKPADAEGREMPIWRLYVRSASFLLAAIPSTIALLISGGAAYVRSLADAKLAEPKSGDGRPSDRDASEPASPAAPEARPEAAKPPVWLAAALGLAGLAAGVLASIFVVSGWALVIGAPIAGLAFGLAISQPVLWTRTPSTVLDNAKGGFGRSLGYWTAAGKAVGAAPVYGFFGGLLGLAWGAAGAAFGLAASFAVAAYDGARQVVYEILPFLRTAFETVMKVLRRIVPFVFGLFAGLVSGVVGSSAFGALLLGRPYFKHVFAEDFKHEGTMGFLGNALLKGVALILGLIFGLIGVVAGVIVAAPYAATAAVSFAFRFAEIGGPAQRYLDHWTYGALRAELQRLNQLTDRFQFPEGEAALSDGWIRMANVLPATIAAAVAGTIAGWVGYFRSLGAAYKSAKSGGPIPTPVVDQDASRRWDRTWRASKKTAASFYAWGIGGAVIGLGIMLMTSWAPLGVGGWLLVAAAAGLGVAGALAVGGVIAMIAMILWLDGQLR